MRDTIKEIGKAILIPIIVLLVVGPVQKILEHDVVLYQESQIEDNFVSYRIYQRSSSINTFTINFHLTYKDTSNFALSGVLHLQEIPENPQLSQNVTTGDPYDQHEQQLEISNFKKGDYLLIVKFTNKGKVIFKPSDENLRFRTEGIDIHKYSLKYFPVVHEIQFAVFILLLTCIIFYYRRIYIFFKRLKSKHH